jgi:5'-3' exonuclease
LRGLDGAQLRISSVHAVKLFQEFGSFEEIYKNREQSQKR